MCSGVPPPPLCSSRVPCRFLPFPESPGPYSCRQVFVALFAVFGVFPQRQGGEGGEEAVNR